MSTKPRTRGHFPRMKVRGRGRRSKRAWASFTRSMSQLMDMQARFARMYVDAIAAACSVDAFTARMREHASVPVFDMPEYPPREPAALATSTQGGAGRG